MASWRIIDHATHRPHPQSSYEWLRAKTLLARASPTASRLLTELSSRWPERTVYLIVFRGPTLPCLYENGFLPFPPEALKHTFLGNEAGVEIELPPRLGTVWWWATRGKDIAHLSPPLALTHELGHLYQWFHEPHVFANYKVFIQQGKNKNRGRKLQKGTRYVGLNMSSHKGNKDGDDYVVKNWELPAVKEMNSYIAEHWKEDGKIPAATYNALLEPGRAAYRLRRFPWDKTAEMSRHARPQGQGDRPTLTSEEYYRLCLQQGAA
jgi:hypothetical protein